MISLRSVVAAGAVIALAACAGGADRSPTPTAADVGTLRLGVSQLPAGCSLQQMKVYAERFFGTRTDPVFTYIARIEEAASGRGPAAAVAPAFDAIKRISQVVGTPDQRGTPYDGFLLTTNIFACTNLTIPNRIILERGLRPGGMFSVRGSDAKDGTTSPVVSRPEAAFDPWVVEPFFDSQLSTWKTWEQSSGGQRFLIYGGKILAFTPEIPAARTSFFEIQTVPDLTFSPALVVGVCDATGARLRVQHDASILTLVTPQLCLNLNPIQGASARAPSSSSFFGGVGGRPSDFSPFAVIDALSLNLAFTAQPRGGRAGRTIVEPLVRVKATSSKGTVVQGVSITLTLAGSPAGVSVGGATAVTGANGEANFSSLTISRAGTYSLVATSTLAGYAAATATSAQFVINP